MHVLCFRPYHHLESGAVLLKCHVSVYYVYNGSWTLHGSWQNFYMKRFDYTLIGCTAFGANVHDHLVKLKIAKFFSRRVCWWFAKIYAHKNFLLYGIMQCHRCVPQCQQTISKVEFLVLNLARNFNWKGFTDNVASQLQLVLLRANSQLWTPQQPRSKSSWSNSTAVSLTCVIPRESTSIYTLHLDLINAGKKTTAILFPCHFFSFCDVINNITKGMPIHEMWLKWLKVTVSTQKCSKPENSLLYCMQGNKTRE